MSATSSAPAATAQRRRPLFALVAALAIAIGGTMWWQTRGKESTDDAQVEADVVALAVRAPGQVVSVAVKDNQAVKAGDLLMELDANDQLARVHGAEAELANARAQLAAAEAQVLVVEAGAKGGLMSARAQVAGSGQAVRSADAQIIASRAALERARANLRQQESDLARAKTLRAANAVAQEFFDHHQAAYDASRAEVEQMAANHALAQEARRQAESRVSEAEGRLGQSRPIEAQIAAAHASVDLARAAVASATARLDLQRLQFSYLKVTAPIDGVISRLSAHVGQLLTVNQAVAEIVPHQTYLVANFKETQVAEFRPGQLARVRIDALGGRELIARVESLSSGTGARFSLLPPDNATGNFVKVVQRVPVRLAWLDLPDDVPLRAGLSADVTIDTRR